MTVKLRNKRSDMPITVPSADGDSVTIMPGAIQEVDDKFNWSLPKGIEVVPDVTSVKSVSYSGKKTSESSSGEHVSGDGSGFKQHTSAKKQ